MEEQAIGSGAGLHWAGLLLKLLRAYAYSIRNSALRCPAEERRRLAWKVLLGALAAATIGMMAYGIFASIPVLARSDASAAMLLLNLPGLLLFGAFWMLLLSSISVTIQRFYAGSEMPLLLLAPLPMRVIFVAKLVEAVTANIGLFLVVGLPAAAAYAMAQSAFSIAYLAHAAVALALFGSLPTVIGSAAAFLLMRILPPNRSRELVRAGGILFGAAVYVGVSILMLGRSTEDALPPGFESLGRFAASPLASRGPWAWAAALIAPAAPYALGNGIELAAALIAVCLGTSWLAERCFWQGWAAFQEAPQRTGAGNRFTAAWEQSLSWMPAPVRGILLKDLMTIRRDLRQMSLLLLPIAASLMLVYNMLRTDPAGPRGLIMVLGMFPVIAAIALRFSMSGFAIENRAMWLIASAPPAPLMVLMAKLLFAASLSLPLALLLAAISAAAADLSSLHTWFVMALSAVATTTFCSIGVGAHGMYLDLKPGNTEATMSGAGRTASLIIEMAYLVGLEGILIGASFVAGMNILPRDAAYLAAGGGTLAWSGAFSAVMLRRGVTSLKRLEW